VHPGEQAASRAQLATQTASRRRRTVESAFSTRADAASR